MMRYLLVGLGNLGLKRKVLLTDRCVSTVDPFNPRADYRTPADCPADSYDAAILAVPNDVKLELVEYFLRRGKSVLVDKPLLFADRQRAEGLDQVARDHRAIWYTSYNHRFEPLVVALRHHLKTGMLGRFYYGRLLYANGTVGDVVGTWRDEGLGVLEDLIPHLLDLADYLFDCRGNRFVSWTLECHEAKSFDHCILASDDPRLVLEASFLSWRNTFAIELFGDRASLHLSGLPKWGPSELAIRERVFPSGVPRERRETAEPPDRTWARDLAHFETLVGQGSTSIEQDWWISQTILGATARGRSASREDE